MESKRQAEKTHNTAQQSTAQWRLQFSLLDASSFANESQSLFEMMMCFFSLPLALYSEFNMKPHKMSTQ